LAESACEDFMYVEQRVRTGESWNRVGGSAEPGTAQLALAFGPAAALADAATWKQLAALYPGARVVACSTAGEISGSEVLEDGLVVTALGFDHGHVAVTSVELGATPDSRALGARLAAGLPHEGLVHVLVISEGIRVNGSALVAGLVANLPAGVGVSGGLSGDGARFGRTVVCLDGPNPTDQIVAVAFYGAHLTIGCGSRGGWDPFGPERAITRSEGNVLHELDGQPALDLYKRYLADHAAALPASGLLFPLTIRGETGDPVVRTLLAVDEANKTMTFAGDVPTGYRARLMTANFERLVDGASNAAKLAGGDVAEPDLAILISCVGRKLVLKQRIDEELEVVRDTFGPATVMTGFYSYGEIAPFSPTSPCELHNQTMTITTISER
jgi:hypothetical protein